MGKREYTGIPATGYNFKINDMETVNVNKATSKDLMKITGVGAKRAEMIIRNRPYRDIYELSKIAGLGKKRMEKIIKQDILIEI